MTTTKKTPAATPVTPQVSSESESEQQTSLDAQEIASKAAQEIEVQEAIITRAQEALSRLPGIIAQAQQERANLNGIRYTALVEHERCSREHAESITYAEIAVGTAREQEAIKDVTRKERSAAAALVAHQGEEARCNPLDQEAQERIAAAQREIEQSQQEIEHAQSRIRAVRSVQERALQELGELVFCQFQTKLQEHDGAIAQARQDLARLTIERENYMQAHLSDLDRWPEHARKIRPNKKEDAVTRVLQAQVLYLESLIADGRALPVWLPGVTCLANYFNWLQVLCVTSDELFVQENLSGKQQMLKSRLFLAKLALEQYQKLGA